MILSEIRSKSFAEIEQEANNSLFSNAEIDSYINEGIRFAATKIHWPRDILNVQVEEGKDTYALPSDCIFPRVAYFGNPDLSGGDVKKIDIWTEESLAEHYPGWLNTDSSLRGRPTKLVHIDRRSVLVHPTPSAEESVAGKKLFLSYVYYPSTLSVDTESPDLPLVYHDFISVYVAHKCYGSKLKDPEKSIIKYKEFISKIEGVEHKVDREQQQMYWAFGNDYSFDGGSESVADHRLI